MRISRKKYLAIIFISIIAVGGHILAASFTIDSLNLEEAIPQTNPPKAYFKIGLKESWKFINDSVLNLPPVTIGIVDTGIDVKHPEFSQFPKVNLGNTPANAKIDSGELVDGQLKSHGTNVAGIIGANNISATSIRRT